MTQRLPHRITAARLIKKLLKVLAGCILMFSSGVFAAPVATPAKLITKFPFTLLTGGIIILQARINHETDSLNFVLDTGSGGISLDSATVKYLGLHVIPSDRTIRGIAGIKKVGFVMNQTLLLPKLVVDSLNFHVNDYALLTSVYGMKIDGIIGFSFFSRYIVKLNYDTHTIEVWQKGQINYPKRGFIIRPAINGIPAFNAAVADAADIKSRFYFDTGAGLCVLLSEPFVKDSAILRRGKKITITQAEGLGGKKPMKITTVKQVRVGLYKFRKVPAYIFEDEFNVTAYPQLGGLIGNDLLRRFNLIINYGEGIIHLIPNTHFTEPFDYSYTGLGMYMVDGAIVIEDVLEGSPGAKAGFLPGDVVISVGGNFSNNIQAYKTLLQTPQSRLKVVVRRQEDLLVFNLKVASIL